MSRGADCAPRRRAASRAFKFKRQGLRRSSDRRSFAYVLASRIVHRCRMRYYRFDVEGFCHSHDFLVDDEAACRAAFDTAIEMSRAVGRLVFVSVYDSSYKLIGRLPVVPH